MIDTLYEVIKMSWCAETAYNKKGEAGSPKGQCLVTALFLQSLYGGKIMRGKLSNSYHYWNYINGEIDLTREQFKDPVFKHIKEVERKNLLRSSDVEERYNLLVRRIIERYNTTLVAELPDAYLYNA